MQIKAGPELTKVLTLSYKANQPPLLIGRHGLGKSEILKQTTEVLKISCVIYDLSIMEPTDLVGIPQVLKGRTVFCPPASLPTSGKGLIIFEELNRAPKYMQAPCLQLLTERKLNGYPLPQGWLPAASINPCSGGYHVDELDPALLSRFVQYEVVPDRDSWLEWARANGVHAKVVEYVAATPDIFDDETNVSTPRSWVYVSNFLRAFESGAHSEETLLASISGCVDLAWASSFMRFYKNSFDVPLTPAEIIDGFQRHEGLVSRWMKKKKMDLIRSSWVGLQNHLQKQENYDRLLEGQIGIKNVRKFVDQLPKDLGLQADEWFLERNYGSLCQE